MNKTIIIDDNKYDILILKKLLEINHLSDDIMTFTSPLEALEYIKNIIPEQKSIVFLDIMMPEMSGLDFLKHVGALTQAKQNMFDFYLVSSTLDPVDIKKAQNDPNVKSLIHKPITTDILKNLLSQ